MDEVSGEAAWANVICSLCKVLITASDCLKSSPQPAQGSLPILTLCPFPIFQTSQFPTKGKACTVAFQIIDTFFMDLVGLLIQSSMLFGAIYFWTNIGFHRPSFEISLHTLLAASAFLNWKIFFKAQPPMPVGFEIFCQLTTAIRCFYWCSLL